MWHNVVRTSLYTTYRVPYVGLQMFVEDESYGEHLNEENYDGPRPSWDSAVGETLSSRRYVLLLLLQHTSSASVQQCRCWSLLLRRRKAIDVELTVGRKCAARVVVPSTGSSEGNGCGPRLVGRIHDTSRVSRVATFTGQQMACSSISSCMVADNQYNRIGTSHVRSFDRSHMSSAIALSGPRQSTEIHRFERSKMTVGQYSCLWGRCLSDWDMKLDAGSKLGGVLIVLWMELAGKNTMEKSMWLSVHLRIYIIAFNCRLMQNVISV